MVVLKTRRSLRAVHFQPHGIPLLLTAEVPQPAKSFMQTIPFPLRCCCHPCPFQCFSPAMAKLCIRHAVPYTQEAWHAWYSCHGTQAVLREVAVSSSGSSSDLPQDSLIAMSNCTTQPAGNLPGSRAGRIGVEWRCACRSMMATRPLRCRCRSLLTWRSLRCCPGLPRGLLRAGSSHPWTQRLPRTLPHFLLRAASPTQLLNRYLAGSGQLASWRSCSMTVHA